MLTYFLLAAAAILLVIRYVRLRRLQQRNLTDEQIDQHLHELVNGKRDQP